MGLSLTWLMRLGSVAAMGGGCAQILGVDWGSYEGGGATSTGTGGGCVDPSSDCPLSGTECVVAVCQEGTCGQQDVPAGTPVASQTPGGCIEVQCDGNGATTDVQRAVQTPCTENGGAFCDGAGSCVECIDGGDCASGVCGAAISASPVMRWTCNQPHRAVNRERREPGTTAARTARAAATAS